MSWQHIFPHDVFAIAQSPGSLDFHLFGWNEEAPRYFLYLRQLAAAFVSDSGDAVMASALLDRVLERCEVINIEGQSYRMRKAIETER